MIEPWLPLAVLAGIQVVDAALCWKPVGFIRGCLRNVGFPQRFWLLLTPLKLSAAAGLILGIWVPPLALLSSAALVGYFLTAIAAHVRARDLGRNLFVNATGMLILCAVTFGVVVSGA